MGSFNTRDDLMNRSGPFYPMQLMGVYKATPTGRFIENDYQYIEVKVLAYTLPARPCYGFGARAAVPSPAWLNKYKDDIFFWVSFEGGSINKCVWLGWCFREGKQKDVDDFPDQAVYRMVHFQENISDKEQEYRLTYTDTNHYFSIGKNGWLSKVKEWFTEVVNVFKIKSAKTVVIANQIQLGSENAAEPYVLGNQLNKNMTATLNQLVALTNGLSTQMSALATAAGANTNTSGLAPGFTAISSQVAAISGQISAIIPNLATQLSKKTTGE